MKDDIEKADQLIEVKEDVDKDRISEYLLKYRDRPVLFHSVIGSKVIGNLYNSKEFIARCMGVDKMGIIKLLDDAIENPTNCSVGRSDGYEELPLDLNLLPISRFYPDDMGDYLTSGVVIAGSEKKRNASFHRMCILDKSHFVIRLVPRHLFELWKEEKRELEISIVVGAPLPVLLAGAMQLSYEEDELEVASRINELCKGQKLELINLNDKLVPKGEFILFGKITPELVKEGPFVDITGTYDLVIRDQPVLEIERIYARKDPVFHTILPGGSEHRMLMGLPKEVSIYKSVSKVVPEVNGVRLTRGGCSWLHGVVSIKKAADGDGKNAILAALAGHNSLKHVVVVDGDIDIYDDEDVEWAMATRFQGDRDMVIVKNARGSSLDPSSDKSSTTKLGFDATIKGDPEKYRKVTDQ